MKFAIAVFWFIAAQGVAVSCRAEQPLSARLCILTAASKLPPVQGLTIKGSRVRDLPDALSKKSDGGTNAVLVELDVNAAAVDVTYSFICAFAPGKPVMVSAVGPS